MSIRVAGIVGDLQRRAIALGFPSPLSVGLAGVNLFLSDGAFLSYLTLNLQTLGLLFLVEDRQ